MRRPTRRQLLIVWPAVAFTVWYRAYWTIVVLLIMASVTVSATVLVLDLAFGVRWGW